MSESARPRLTRRAGLGWWMLAERCPRVEREAPESGPYEPVARAKGMSLVSWGPGLQIPPPASSRWSVLQAQRTRSTEVVIFLEGEGWSR